MTETRNSSVFLPTPSARRATAKALYPNDQPHEKAPGQWGLARELGRLPGNLPASGRGCGEIAVSRWS